MKEIKFRAWDRVLNQFLPNIQNHIGNSEWAFGNMLKDEIGRYTIEQYTELKDKNGREIYEGDILEDPKYDEPFVVEYHAPIAGYVGWGDDRIAGCYLITEEDLEIIGNIHENPELLNT